MENACKDSAKAKRCEAVRTYSGFPLTVHVQRRAVDCRSDRATHERNQSCDLIRRRKALDQRRGKGLARSL